MENKGEVNTENQKQKFTEKYGIWILVTGMISGILILKLLFEIFQKQAFDIPTNINGWIALVFMLKN